jgi:hypothetical protein
METRRKKGEHRMWIVTKRRGKAKRARELVKFQEHTAKAELYIVRAGEPGEIKFKFVGVDPDTGERISIVASLTVEQAISISGQLTEEVWADGVREDEEDPAPFREAT